MVSKNRLDAQYVKDLYGSMSNMLKKQAPLNGVDSTNKQLAALALLMTGDELMKEFFKRSWAESGYIKKNGDRYRHVIKIWGSTASCTLIELPESDDEDEE